MDFTSALDLDSSPLTPEKLALIKLRTSEADRDAFSEPDTSGEGLFSSMSRSKGGVSRALTTRTTRQASGMSRRNTFMQSHRSKMSMELTGHAEAKVFALIELMANASREAAALKEYWTKLMSERESFEREREELTLRIDELSETVERTENQHHGRHRELADRKKEVERLLVELSSALGHVSEYKKKIAERERELDIARRSGSESDVLNIRLQSDYEKIKSEFDLFLPRLRAAENERDRIKVDAELFRGQVRDHQRENSDLKGRNGDITVRLEASAKEITSYLERIRVFERERASDLFERERLEEAVRKATLKADDANRELLELSERSSTWQRESRRFRESLTSVETERDEQATLIEKLRFELKNKSTSLEEAESRHGDIHLKYEQLKREISVKEDRFGSFETEIAELRRTVETKQEEHRRTLFENDSLRDDVENAKRKLSERDSEFTVIQDSLSKSESTLVELRSESLQYTERIRHLERERDEANDKSGGHGKELVEVKERLNVVQLEIRTLTDARDRARKELQEFRRRYEEITQTITEWKDDSGELEYEIESLRTMLYEAREQKERAIAARNAADRERDESLEKYYDKCRELEKLADSRSSFFSSSHASGRGHGHGHGKSESRTTSTRFVSKSSAANGGEDETVIGPE